MTFPHPNGQPARRAGLWLAAAVLAGACAGGQPADSAVTRRDSAGIGIVENADASWVERAPWSVTTEPIVQLGGSGDREGEGLYRVAGGVLLDDGRVAIANAGSQEVRWYDATGVGMVSAGGRGEGPGEFVGLGAIARMPGDSVVAYDVRLRRLTVFAPGAEFVRVASLDVGDHQGMEFPSLEGVLPDGSLLMAGRIMDTGTMQEGPIRAAVPAYRFSGTGELLDSLATFPGWEATVIMRRTADGAAPAITTRPFAKSTSMTAIGSGFAAATPTTFEYRVFDSRGALTGIVRLDREARTLTRDDIDAYEASIDDRLPDDAGRRALRQQIDAWVYPETIPAFGSDLIGDADGNVWVPNFTVTPDPPTRWSVFDVTGRYLGDLDIPPRVKVLDIRGDRLLGLWRDESDVEYVRVYAIRKP